MVAVPGANVKKRSRSMGKISRKSKTIALKIVLASILVFGYTFYIYPVAYFQKFESVYLYFKSVKFQKTKHFDYFEKNNCSSNKNCECVLLVHGLGDFAYTWSKTLASKKLKNTHMYAVNLPGSLDSPKLEGDDTYSLQNLAEHLKNEILPICPSWTVVGNSYGGWLSLKLAEEDLRVKKLVLISPAGLKKNYQHILDYYTRPDANLAREFYHKAYYKTYNVPTFIFESIVRRAKAQPTLNMLKAVRESDYVQSPINLNRPTLILWGASDKVLPTEWAEEYHQYMVGSDIKIFNECGHIPQKECFTEFENALVSFLKID